MVNLNGLISSVKKKITKYHYSRCNAIIWNQLAFILQTKNYIKEPLKKTSQTRNLLNKQSLDLLKYWFLHGHRSHIWLGHLITLSVEFFVGDVALELCAHTHSVVVYQSLHTLLWYWNSKQQYSHNYTWH